MAQAHIEHTPLGVHYILEFYDCRASGLLSNVDEIDHVMVEAAHRGNASVVSHHFQQFDPYGVSGAVILEESHITVHTWPEHNYAAIDVFFCDFSVDYPALKAYLETMLLPGRIEEQVLNRGTAALLEVVA